LAIGATKEMIETVMKTILAQRGISGLDALNFPDLMHRSLTELGLKSAQAPASDIERNLRQIASGAQKILEFLVRPHGIFIGGRLSVPLAVVKVLKTLDRRCAQAAMAFTGGAVERTGPDFR
jgi:hypothetical protein